MPELRIAHSIAEIGEAEWNALFPEAIETYGYLAAVEDGGLAGFRWRYAVALEDGKAVAAVPGFLTAYDLDTTLTGAGKRLAGWIKRLAPKLLTLRLACLGSPCTENVAAGFHAGLGEAERQTLLGALVRAFGLEAAREGCTLHAVKDVRESQQQLWSNTLRSAGYRPTPGLPIASLAIDFADTDAYLARLSPGTRKDMRRKLRSLRDVDIEITRDVAPVIDEVIALYRQTRDRADMQFEDLTPGFFTAVTARMGGGAFYVLYRVAGRLLGFNLLLQDHDTLLDKYFCMDAAGRDHNLYFLSWFTNVRLCIERGLRVYQSGQAAYRNKVRLGSALEPTAMYFRHRNVLINGVLQRVAPFFAFDATAELAA